MKKRYIALLFFVFCDIISAIFSVAVSSLITYENIIMFDFDFSVFTYIFISVCVIVVFYIFKIYNILWRYSNIASLIRIVVSIFVTLAIYFISSMAVFGYTNKYLFYASCFLIANTLIMTHRLLFKKMYNIYKFKKIPPKLDDNSSLSGNIMIIGAGSAGEIIINEINRKKEYSNCKIKCIIDDSVYKWGQYISGIKIIGGRELIVKAAEKYGISYIVFAIPNCPSEEKSKILNICQQTNCRLKIIPSVCKMIDFGEISTMIRRVEIEDLLGREPVILESNDKNNYIKDKVVLVTGGGGSIGSELCRQIALQQPKQLIIFDVYENNAYDIQNELSKDYPELNLVTLIGSVRDSKRMEYVFKNYKPHIVYHAAAHKHVPLMEDSPNETIKNNIYGTYKTAKCADIYGAEKFVLISTDKAVNPTNIMGASKRICEMIVQTFNNHSKTEFVAVRFGNVLGSNGSVIPLFKKQISDGGPVTVTHPEIIRYFMTISEAVSLVIEAGSKAKGGEIFVLDMGKPVKILTLAENLIKLSGLVPYKDIDIKFTGLRPGEKLFEELLMEEEGLTATENELIHIGRPIDIDEELLNTTLEEMKECMYNEDVDVRKLIHKIVPTYIYLENK